MAGVGYLSHMNHKLQAGILSYVLAISLLVSTGLSMLTLYVYYARVEYKLFEKKNRLLENAATGIDLTRADAVSLSYNEWASHDLYGDGLDSVSIRKLHWGLLDRYEVLSFFKELSFSKHYILAPRPTHEGRSAVYLQDDGRPVSVVGNTKLTGTCYLPKAGIQSAYINRVGYTNKELIYGDKKQSDKKFPEVHLEDYIKEVVEVEGVLLDEPADTVHSFQQEVLIIEGTNLALFSKLKGHIIIRAREKIVFSAEANLEDIVAYAPVIELDSGFEGSGQFFARDTIVVHKYAKLKYPSVLAVYNKDKPAIIHLQDSSEVNGWIVMDGRDEGLRRRIVFLDDQSTFTGMIYCNGMVECYGQILGNVTTRRFLVNAPSAVYENYLMNATIDAMQLPPDFLILPHWFSSDSTEVLKYLY